MATTLSFGKCSECGENNNMQAKQCRKCNALLPWAVPKPGKFKKEGPAGGKPPKMQVIGPKTPVVSSEAATRWGLGLAVFFLCLILSPVGAFIVHRWLSSSESELAGFAEAGLYLCVALWALSFVGVMATVGNKSTP